MGKYVAVRMPKKAYEQYVKRKEKLESVATKLVRRPVRIPMTKVFAISAENPIQLPDWDLVGVIKKRRKKSEA